MEEYGTREGMAAFTLVADGVRAAAQFGIGQPVADEDRAFDPACLARAAINRPFCRGGG